VRRGRGSVGAYVASIIAMGTLLGILLAPRRTLAAWRASKAMPLWAQDVSYEEVLDLTVGELRERLGVPREGLATHTRRLHARAPGSAS
jgi:hypothetical protein